MRSDQAEAKIRHYDGHPRTLVGVPGVGARTQGQPTRAMANYRTTVGLIAGLLLTWVIIVV